MWIIVEGCDGSGKTTLVEEISNKADATISHLGPPDPPEAALDIVIGGAFGTYAPGSGVNIVSDRHHWGGPVYGPVKRPESDLDGYGEIGKAGWRYAELFAASRGAVTILVDIEPDLARARLELRGDEYVESRDLDEVIERYHWLAADSLTLFETIELTKPEETELAATDAIAWAFVQESRVAAIAGFKHYVGSIKPQLLVVMPPDRDMRLDVVGTLDDVQWQQVGIASTAMSGPALDDLCEVLGSPQLLGFDRIPHHLESGIAAHSGSFTRDLVDLRKFAAFI